MKKNKKNIAALITSLALVANLAVPATILAYSFNVPGSGGGTVSLDLSSIVTEGASSIESRYGFNSDVLKTAERKVTAPKVEISFDNTNPKAGDKVTAHALPEFFKNDTKNLYYTWYIIHTTDGTTKTATNTMKSGKIEAARLMARGDYDPDLDGQTYSDTGKDPDSDGWPSVDTNSYDADTSAAPMGGADGTGGLQSNSDNSESYSTASGYCGAKGTQSCSYNTDKSSFNQYYNLQATQSGDYCTYCQQNTAFSATLTSDNQCCYLVQNPSDTTYASYDSGTSYCPGAYSADYESCFDYSTLQSTNEALVNTCVSTQYTACTDNWTSVHGSNNAVEGTTSETFSRCYKHNFGTNTGATGYRGYTGSSGSYGSDDSGLDYSTSCKHKWEDATGYTSGSGKFTTGEEKYWKTDPADPDTDGDGFVDGADVIGLGQQDFAWTYQSGDRVGVVVEGTSMIPTDEKNAYYKIMWGYPDVCDSTKTGLLANDECDSSDDYGYGFLATQAPNESTGEKLKISLASSPDSPLADTSDDNSANIATDGTISDADKITVTSSLDNTELNASDLYYTWQIQKGTLGDDTSWKELTIADNFETTTASSGLGLSSFSFTPKSSAMKGTSDLVYFKVTLTVAKSSGTATKSGRASTTISVNKKGVKLKLYKVAITDSKAALGDEICSSGASKTLCPVAQNQMLAAKVSSSNYTATNSDFSWNINGEDYAVPSDTSTLFTGWSDTTIFFPVGESEGDTPQVTVKATPKTTLLPVTGSRTLSVVSPTATIGTADSSASWAKTYTAEDSSSSGSTETVESSDVFEAISDTAVSYSLSFVPSHVFNSDSNTAVDWKINGTSIDESGFSAADLGISDVTTENNKQTLKFTAGSTEGTYYTLEATVKKYWSTAEKNILSTTWGITPSTLESDTTANVSLVSATEGSETSATSLANPGQILAAIGTHLPHYFMYLLRLVLTLVIMFFVSAVLYGITQKTNLYDEN